MPVFAQAGRLCAPAADRGLLSILPAHCVLHREEDTRPYECDGLSLYRALPAGGGPAGRRGAGARHHAAVQAHERADRGARRGTGLSGGAMPHAQGVLLGLSKLNRISA